MKINWKKLVTSKTLWFNLAATLAPLLALTVPDVQAHVTPRLGAAYAALITTGNFVLRFMTSQPLIVQAIEAADEPAAG